MNKTDFFQQLREIKQLRKTACTPLDEKDRDKRLAKARKDVLYFAKTYFPHYVTAKPAKMHREMVELTKTGNSVIAVPRGFGKTKLISIIDVIHKAVFGLRYFVLEIGSTKEIVSDTLGYIKAELEENERLILDFAPTVGSVGDVTYKDRQYDIVTTVGGHSTRILGMGARQSLRGVSFRQYRPDHIVADDLETYQSVRSEKRTKELLRWIMGALYPSLAPSSKEQPDISLVIIGNVLGRTSAMAHLLGMARDDESKRYRKVFKQVFYSAMNGKDRSNWPARFSTAFLREARTVVGPVIWAAEYMNQPVDDGVFREEWIKRWTELPKRMTVWGAVDPAMGSAQGDFVAIVMIGVHERKIYVLSSIIEKMTPEQTKRVLYNEYIRWNPVQIVVETNGFQALFADRIQTDIPMPLKSIKQTEKKIMRLMRLAPYLERGEILFPPRDEEKPGHERLIEQILAIPHGSHDDGADVLEMAIQQIHNTYDVVGMVF